MNKEKWYITTLFNLSCKLALIRSGSVGILLLGAMSVAPPVYAEEILLPAKYHPLVQSVIDAANRKDHRAMARQIAYPLKREYPLAEIRDQQEMLTRFDEVFDGTLLATIGQSRVEQDWHAMGWRGIMLGSGQLWLDYDGKIVGINYQTPLEAKLKASLIARQTAGLYPGLREYEHPELRWQTEKFTIRIDDMGNNRYRYASWAKGKPLSDKPDLVLTNGKQVFDGSGGNHSFQFESGPYQYHCEVTVLGESDSPPGALVVYKQGVEVLRQPVLKSE